MREHTTCGTTQGKRRRGTYLQDVRAANAVEVRLLHLEQVIKRDTVILSLEPNRDEVPAKLLPVPAHHANAVARHTEAGAGGIQQSNTTIKRRARGCQCARSANRISGSVAGDKSPGTRHHWRTVRQVKNKPSSSLLGHHHTTHPSTGLGPVPFLTTLYFRPLAVVVISSAA